MAVACSGSEDAEPATATSGNRVTETTAVTSTESSAASVTETTSAPESSTAEAASDERGTRDAPVAAGETVRVGEWDVTVLSATEDATDAVLEENEFNDPPGEGKQFFFVEVSATYQGDDSEALFTGLTVTTVGDSAVAYDFEDTCGVIPDELDTFSEVFQGGTEVGNLCWQVLTEDVGSLVLIVDNAFSFDDDRAYLALRYDVADRIRSDQPEGCRLAGSATSAWRAPRRSASSHSARPPREMTAG